MAYKNLVRQLCANKKEAFCRIRDFLCKRNGTYDYSSEGIGWILWDSSYAVDEDNPAVNDWFVIYSPGESGKDDIFIRFLWNNNSIGINAYLSWDPSTHAGSTTYICNGSTNFTFSETESNPYIWVYGDLDNVLLIQDYSVSFYYGCSFGAFDPADTDQDRETATCSSALTAGSDVSITVDAVPSNWEVGSDLFIRTTHTDNISTVKMEVVTIKTISGNTITVDLVNSYTANCKLCSFLFYSVNYGNTFLATYVIMMNNLGATGANGTTVTNVLPITYFSPSSFEDRYLITEAVIHSGNAGSPVAKTPQMYIYNSFVGSLSMEDVMEDVGGGFWRIFLIYSSKLIAVKEV